MKYLIASVALFAAVTAEAQLDPIGDLNSDGLVGVGDLMTLLGVFGNNYNELNAHPDCVPIEYNGYTYEVVQIGNHCWFAENLRTELDRNGNPIPYIDDLTEWAELERYDAAQTIYEFNDSLLAIHGRLYTWNAAIEACPTGWGVGWDTTPWFLLETESGMPVTSIAGLWARGQGSGCGVNLLDQSESGTNTLGFSALLSGDVFYSPSDSTAHFYGLNERTAFWTSTALVGNFCQFSDEMYMGGGLGRELLHPQFSDAVIRRGYTAWSGISVRCNKYLGDW